MPSSIHLHRSLTDGTREITFLVEIDRLINAIYDPLVQEFFTFEELKFELTQDAVNHSDQLLTFMSYGYSYLRVAQKSEFYDVVRDIDYDSPFYLMKDYVLENANERFIGYLAYTLLAETDIEEYLDKPKFKLSSIHHSFVTFSYFRERRVMGILNQHYQR